MTVPDHYSIPHIQDFIATRPGVPVFSKVDVIPSYHQSPVDPDDIPTTAVTTLFDLFKFLRMPFGLRSAAQTFKHFIDQVLQGLHLCYVFLDDIPNAGTTAEKHQEHLCLLFTHFW